MTATKGGLSPGERLPVARAAHPPAAPKQSGPDPDDFEEMAVGEHQHGKLAVLAGKLAGGA